jgi:hypothetical protein
MLIHTQSKNSPSPLPEALPLFQKMFVLNPSNSRCCIRRQVTLTWTDPAVSALASRLVLHDLDLLVVSEATGQVGWFVCL